MTNLMNHKPPQTQHGAALVVALVMLVILTLIGVAAMNSSTIELIMAGNTQLQTRALAEADRTLTTAETMAKGLTVVSDFSEAGYYNIKNEAAPDIRTMTWTSANSQQADTDMNRYVVEFTGNFAISGNSEAWGVKGTATSVDVFRITSHSEDAKGAVRMVQSVYVR